MNIKKRCSRCKEFKSVTLFGRDKTNHSRDGYKCRCRECDRIVSREAWHKKVESQGKQLKFYPTDYQFNEHGECIARRCSVCKEIKSATEFTKDPKRKTGITHRCKSCKAAMERQPERMNSEYHKNSRRNHSLLKKNSQRKHTEEQWETLKSLSGNKCLYPDCNNTKVTRDHIVPLKLGGDDGIDNIQPLCLPHNSSKQHYSSIDYRSHEVKEWAKAEANLICA